MIVGCYLVIVGFVSSTSMAQSGGFANIAYPITIGSSTSTDIVDGSIISYQDGVFILTKREDDPDIVGVAQTSPAVYYEDKGSSVEAYLVSGGTAYVRVSGENGPIRNGDFITSSKNTGVGVKGVAASHFIGRALENYEAQGVGKILVQVNPETSIQGALEQGISGERVKSTVQNVTTRIFDVANLFTLKEPSRAFRYLLAIMIALISIIFGFIMFGRIVFKSIDGMSRNPLASKLIILSVLMNLILSIVVSGSGLLLAYIITVY